MTQLIRSYNTWLGLSVAVAFGLCPTLAGSSSYDSTDEAVRFLRVTAPKNDAVRADLLNRTVDDYMISYGSNRIGSIVLSSSTGKVISFMSHSSQLVSWGFSRPNKNVFKEGRSAREELLRMAQAIGLPDGFQLVSLSVTDDTFEDGSDFLFNQGRASGVFKNPGQNAALLNASYSAIISLDVHDGSLSSYRLLDKIVRLDVPIQVTKEEAALTAVEFAGTWFSSRGLSVASTKFGYAIKHLPNRQPRGVASKTAVPAWEVLFSDENGSSVIVDAVTGLVIDDRRRG